MLQPTRTSPTSDRGSQEAKPSVILKFDDIDLTMIPTLDECRPGFKPREYNVLIAPMKLPEKTAGGLLLADETKDRMLAAAQVGRIAAMSPIAFNFDAWPEDDPPPQVGDIVYFARYAGGLMVGRDGREYRVLKDKDISGIVETD